MTRSPLLAWLFLALWAAWASALQGLAAGPEGLGRWVPDLALVLALSLAARLPGEDMVKVALAVALGRIAVSIQPPVALLAGFLGILLLARGLRSVLELGGPLQRTLLGALAALLLAGWLGLVHAERARDLAGQAVVPGAAAGSLRPLAAALGAWPAALSTGLCALLLGPALARLPGLTPLRRRRPWSRAASLR
jgi:hypothetical protein